MEHWIVAQFIQMYAADDNGTFLSEGEFHHTRDSSPVKNGFSHIDPMLEVDSLIYQLHHVLLYIFL